MIHARPIVPVDDGLRDELVASLKRQATRANRRADYWRAFAAVMVAVAAGLAVVVGVLAGRACP